MHISLKNVDPMFFKFAPNIIYLELFHISPSMLFLGFQCFRYFDVAVHSVTSSLVLKLRNQAIRVHTKRQVIIKMNKFNMLITAVCVLF